MVDRTLVSAKLVELRDRLARVRAHCPAEADALRADRDALDLVAFNLMLAVQVCADVASHIIADEGWPPARTLGEGFTLLEKHGVIAAELGESLRRAVGLRNVVAHGYAGVDAALVHRAAVKGADDLESFARSVASWATRQ
jgi:uncharacterized protein YutE (UPF0331/DUF86 family)